MVLKKDCVHYKNHGCSIYGIPNCRYCMIFEKECPCQFSGTEECKPSCKMLENKANVYTIDQIEEALTRAGIGLALTRKKVIDALKGE